MSAATAILCKPTSTTSITSIFLPRYRSLKIDSSPDFPSSKLLFSGEFVSRKSVSRWKRSGSPNTMSGSISTSAFRDSTGDEGVGALEQESFIHGSSDFCPNFTASELESTLNRLSKWLVTALFGAVLLWRHDAEALWAAMGSVVNAGLSTILKQILNQERPISTLRSDPGMPSSHAQSIFFSIIFAVTSMIEWLGANGLTITLSGLTLAFGSYLSWLRVSQQLHTTSQVVVGAVLGSIFSILWFWSWDAIVLKAFISYLWVRIFIVFGATGFCLGFLIYIIRVMDIEPMKGPTSSSTNDMEAAETEVPDASGHDPMTRPLKWQWKLFDERFQATLESDLWSRETITNSSTETHLIACTRLDGRC